MNVICYQRVSTDEQADKGFSLRHQEEMLKKYCEVKNLTIAQSYTDDYSAKNFDRPEWQKLYVYVKANKRNIDKLLFTKWDRFSRNIEEALRIIREFRDMGIEVNAIEQPLDLSNPDNKAMLTLYLVMPEVEYDKISSRTKDGMLRANKEGCWTGRAPFGYNNHRNELEKSTLIKDSTTSMLVVESFNEVTKGVYSIDHVRRMMNSKGMKVSKQGFMNLLRNKAYIGKVVVPEYKKEVAYEVKGLHEPIIDEETFYSVQAIISGKRKASRLPSHRNDLFPLRNYLICEYCGGNLTASESKGNGGKYGYYHCRKGCPNRIRSDIAESMFTNLVTSLKVNKAVIKTFSAMLKDTMGRNELESMRKLADLRLQKEKLQDNIIAAENKMLNNDITVETYNNIVNRLNQHLMNLNADIALMENKKENPVNYLVKAGEVLCNLDTFYNTVSYELKRALIGSICPEKVEISKEGCRTKQTNTLIELLLRIGAGFSKKANGQEVISNDLSIIAPPPGLEPGTPRLTVLCSNQLS